MIQSENNGVNEGTSNISHFAMILYPELMWSFRTKGSICSLSKGHVIYLGE